MALAIPTRYLEPNHWRNLKPEEHLAPAQVRHELMPLLGSHLQGGAAQLSGDYRRILRFLIKREQQRGTTYAVVLIVHRQVRGIIVNPDVLVGITRSSVVDYVGILESNLLGQGRNWEFVDVESGPVGAQT